jgi:GNAT superfamily N-acetyltransferase
MTAATLHDLTPADYASWMPLWRAYQTFYKADIPADVSHVTWTRLLDADEPVFGALAVADGQAVGLAHWLMHRSTWSVADFCYLNDLFVVPDMRGRGIGRALIEHVYDAAAARNCTQVYWLTHETNVTAQRLYDGIANRTGFIHFGKPLVP